MQKQTNQKFVPIKTIKTSVYKAVVQSFFRCNLVAYSPDSMPPPFLGVMSPKPQVEQSFESILAEARKALKEKAQFLV